MAELRITTDNFHINSSWYCSYQNGSWIIYNGPTTNTHSATFEWDALENAEIKSAKIHASLLSPSSGATRVNDLSFDSDGFASVSIDSAATSFDATFSFKANGIVYEDANQHQTSQSFSDVYLLIEYESLYTPPELIEYTDSEIISGETYVKAVHMTEIHTNVNLVRIARKLGEYTFSDILAMETSLAGWNDHVVEIRTAIDETGIAHEDWIVLSENYPRLDVLLQLRRVVQAVSAG